MLHSEKTTWEAESADVHGSDRYETLKCGGCDAVKLRHTAWCSEDDEPVVTYYPPAIFRPQPKWFSDLWVELKTEDEFVENLLREIYVALQNNSPNLAAMGIRSLLEKIMISKTTDLGAFSKNISEFERLGYVSRIQRERLEAILEVGHATIHRAFAPTTKDVVTLVDIAEHIVEAIYLHERKVNALKGRVPPRTMRAK